MEELAGVLCELLQEDEELLPEKARAAMLRHEDNEDNEDNEGDEDLTAQVETLLPTRPYFRVVAHRLWRWGETGDVGLPRVPPLSLVEEVESPDERLQRCTGRVVDLVSRWASLEDPIRREETRTILRELHVQGVLFLLGMRRTIGSVNHFPPSTTELIRSFHHAWHPSSTLTVGARALAKHHSRSANKWWGVIKGNDAVKNVQADDMLRTLLQGATWMNAHLLPHGVVVFEIRNEEGYGARWWLEGEELFNAYTYDTWITEEGKPKFRGFLEPPMLDGHEKGWRH